MIIVRDEIRDLIMSIQSTGIVDSFVDNTGSYTVHTTSTGNLEVGFKVVLVYSDITLNRDVVITAKTDTSFTFTGTGITQPTSWKMAVYFEIGHRAELVKKYANKANAINKMVQEYPLVWLYTDFENKESELEACDFETTLQFAICDFTEKTLYESQRIENKFKPVLYPILELIDAAFNGIYKRKFVVPYGQRGIQLMFIERPFFGSMERNEGVLPQPTDAIEFQVDLKWRNQDPVCSGY